MPVTVPIAEAISASIEDLSRDDAPQASEAPVESTPSAPPSVETEAPAPATPEPVAEAPAPVPDLPLDDESTVPVTGNIPVERHKAILNKYRSKADQLKWAESLNPQELQQKLAILEFAEQNPQEFMRRFDAAMKADPRFRQAEPTPQPVAEAKPEPDVLLSDGTLTYSQPQLDKLLEWRERQIVSRFEPVEKAFRSNQVWGEAVQKARQQLADAQQHWPGFQSAEAEIAGFLKANPTASLEQAYRSVVMTKMTTDEARIRAEERQRVLAEFQTKAGVTSTRAPAASLPPRDPETGRWRSPGEIAREEYERLTAT